MKLDQISRRQITWTSLIIGYGIGWLAAKLYGRFSKKLFELLRRKATQIKANHTYSFGGRRDKKIFNGRAIKEDDEEKKQPSGDNIIEPEKKFIENISLINKKISQQDIEENVNILDKHFIFQQLSRNLKEEMMQKMFYCKNNVDLLFKTGDLAQVFFILQKGECIFKQGQKEKILKKGDSFGDKALLYESPRECTVICKGECEFWAIDRETYKTAVDLIIKNDQESNKQLLMSIKLFEQLNEKQITLLAESLLTEVYKKGDRIIEKGDIDSKIYLIKKGKVFIETGGDIPVELQAGQQFGNSLIKKQYQQQYAVIANDESVHIVGVSVENLEKIFGDNLANIQMRNMVKQMMQNNNILKDHITQEQIDNVSKNVQLIVTQEHPQVIFKKGQPINKVVFMMSGFMAKASNNESLCQQNEIFGLELLEVNNEGTQDDILIMQQSQAAEISFKKFIECIGGSIATLEERKLFSNEIQRKLELVLSYDATLYDYLLLEEMIFIKHLGSGSFAEVYLVKNKQDNQLYVLKSLSKAKVVINQQSMFVIREKQVLEIINFPLIMHYFKIFKDEYNVYFLMQFIRGIEFFDALRDIGIPTLDQARFIIGGILLSIEYLHSKNIIYRDLKPENIIVNQNGFPILVDMGLSKILKNDEKTQTVLGTPNYMAPEIMLGKGYSYEVDLWSLGILLYETLCSKLPFGQDLEDPYEIYQEILKISEIGLSFPKFLTDRQAKALIKQLLSMNPATRMGGESFQDLKSHPWFETAGFDWPNYLKMIPKYIPPKNMILKDEDIKAEDDKNQLAIDLIDKRKIGVRQRNQMGWVEELFVDNKQANQQQQNQAQKQQSIQHFPN